MRRAAALAPDVVGDACAYISESQAIPSLERLADRAGCSRHRFLRMFRDHTGVTPRSYAEGVRARRMQAAPPRVGTGEIIRTSIADSPFGRLLLGATQAGVCFLGFGEPDDALLGDLRRRFPRARVATDDAALADSMHAVLCFLRTPRRTLTLPLDLHGTAFQRRVWQALCAIPPGETRSYGQLAAAIGAPRAIRAVARSCATNPVSLAVPCHRVVGSTGDLTGYRWGLPRKRALLALEQAAMHG